MDIHKEVSDLPLDIGMKLSTTSLENPNWHTDMVKRYTTVISCNISQTQYLCQKLQLSDTSIYKYIWENVIDIYDTKNNAKYTLSYNITEMFEWIHNECVSIQILHY